MPILGALECNSLVMLPDSLHARKVHCAIGTGHIANKIRKLGKILGIETVIIC